MADKLYDLRIESGAACVAWLQKPAAADAMCTDAVRGCGRHGVGKPRGPASWKACATTEGWARRLCRDAENLRLNAFRCA